MSLFFCASAREVKNWMVAKTTTATKNIGEMKTWKEDLTQLKTKSAIEIIVMLIEEKNEKMKKIDLVVTKIYAMMDVVIKLRDEESKQNHEKSMKWKRKLITKSDAKASH